MHEDLAYDSLRAHALHRSRATPRTDVGSSPADGPSGRGGGWIRVGDEEGSAHDGDGGGGVLRGPRGVLRRADQWRQSTLRFFALARRNHQRCTGWWLGAVDYGPV